MIDLTAVEAVAAMRAGELRAEDYARALLERAARHESLNAFRALDEGLVIEAARKADKARAAGSLLGLLHGLPVPVKDSVNTKALPTSNGTRSLQNFRPRDDAAVLKALFAQGASLMGKTNLHELSRGWTSNNGAFGAIRNPYDPGRIPGGSSGGSAAAVAARMAPLAVAEDTWGSIRVPAAMCGVVGFRPTLGRYSNAGIMPLTHGKLDQVGPIARSVADVALFDAVASGDFHPIEDCPLRGVRVGIPVAFLEGMDRAVERVVEAAFDRLRAAGAIVVRCELPPEAALASDIASTIIGCENAESIDTFLAAHEAGVTFGEMMAQASPNIRARYASPPPADEAYRAALQARERLTTAIRESFNSQAIAVLAFPPILAPPPLLGDNAEIEVGGERVPIRTVVARNTALGSCASMASLVLPAGMTPGGLPVALEFDALAGNDRWLLSIGRALEVALGPIPAPALGL